MPARVYPDPLPDWVRDNPLREAEVKVYDVLRSQLSSRYVMFYSRPWIGTNYDGTEKEGEADFVVASAETGYLVIEVKGGGVGRDSRNGEWFSIDRYQRRHTIKDPIKQALRSKNELLERLRQHREMTGQWIGAASAVVLPDCTGAETLDSMDTPLDHFALFEDMKHLGAWVRARLEHTIGDRGGALGPKGIATLEQLLARTFQLRIPLSSTIAEDYERVVTVTEQQYALLDFLVDHPRAAIGGAAGSGKTILALHKAIELASAAPSERFLLTCYNAPLAVWLRRAARRTPNLQVGSFHEICSKLAKSAGILIPKEVETRAHFDDVLPNALLEAIDSRPELAYAGIIVDEGQDFSDRWLEVLQLVLCRDSSPFWIFFDDNQKLYGRSTSLLQTMPQAPFVLRKNVRNPRPVFDRLMPFLGSSTVVPLGPKGRPVEEILVKGNSSLRSRLSALVARFVEDEQVDPADIAILVARQDQIEELCPDGKFGSIPSCRADAESGGRVCLDTVRRFKGLERKVVVLVEPAEIASNDELFYVGLSRPTAHLVMIGTKGLQLQLGED